MRINLGCGDRYADGWINVDVADMPHRKDEAVDLCGPLPWADGSADRIYAGHVFEHIPLASCRILLPQLRDILRVGGILMVVGPDCEKAWEMERAGTLDVSLDSLRYGAGRWSGDHHEWECTEKQLAMLLVDAGFAVLYDYMDDVVANGWPVADPGPEWQACVRGIRM